MLTTEQLEIRKSGIGGSEIAAVAGLNPWMSPLDVYLRKRGLVGDEQSFHSERGTFFEPAVLNWYAHRTGSQLSSPGTIVHPELARVIATPDALAIRGDERRGVEVKMPGRHTLDHWGEPGTDEIPDYYVPQTQWEAAVLGVQVVDAVTLIDDDLAVYPVRFDVELFAALVDMAQRFWHDHIEQDVPPPVDGSERARKWLLERYPKATLTLIEATDEMIHLAQQYDIARAEASAAEKRKDFVGNKLRALLGDHAGVQGGNVKVTYKNNKDSSWIDYESIVKSLDVPKDIIASHTHKTAGSRVLRVTVK
jgi:putative phage-type endonuclease